MKSIGVFCSLILLLFATPSFAEKIPVEKIDISTPVYQANTADFEPALGLHEYSVKWGGIGAARIKINVEQEGLNYQVSTEAKTNSFIDIFYKLRYSAAGTLSMADFLPLRSVLKSRENSKEHQAEVLFLPNGEIKSTYWRKGREKLIKQFDPGNFMLDPFSAAFIARSLDWEKGQTRKFDTYNGKSRYLIEFTLLGTEKMKVNSVEKDVWVVSPKVRKLTETNPKNKLRSAKIYITADKRREILKIVSSVFIGSVTTRLESFTPSSTSGQTHLASAKPKVQKIRLH